MGLSFSAINTNETEDHGRFGVHPKRVAVPGFEEMPLHWNGGNAIAMFRFLGLEIGDDCGEIEIPLLRRAVLRARSRANAAAFTRAERAEYGAPRATASGAVELRPLRALSFGIDAAGILERAEHLERFAMAAAALGATRIAWY